MVSYWKLDSLKFYHFRSESLTLYKNKYLGLEKGFAIQIRDGWLMQTKKGKPTKSSNNINIYENITSYEVYQNLWKRRANVLNLMTSFRPTQETVYGCELDMHKYGMRSNGQQPIIIAVVACQLAFDDSAVERIRSKLHVARHLLCHLHDCGEMRCVQIIDEIV